MRSKNLPSVVEQAVLSWKMNNSNRILNEYVFPKKEVNKAFGFWMLFGRLFTPHHSHFVPARSIWLYDTFVHVGVRVCVRRKHSWRRLIARKTEQPLVRVNNSITVGRSRLMTADRGWGGETGDEFNYLEHTLAHLLTHYLSHTSPWQRHIAFNGEQ